MRLKTIYLLLRTKPRYRYFSTKIVASPVTISYESLKNPNSNLEGEIEEAFGYHGLGLIVVKGIPEYTKLRENLLPLGSTFAKLPDHIKQKYVHENSHYSFGWSHGKEKLKEGKPDFYKGSYYNNPQYDVPTTDPTRIAAAPEVCCENIWPKDDLSQLEGSFKTLGQLIVNVGILLAHHCDKYVLSKLGDRFHKENYLENVIKTSCSAKARLLHYFEISDAKNLSIDDIDNWCGWHNDHSSLTGLCSAMFQDIRSGKIINSPDPDAGLYVKTRTGGTQQVKIPADCLGFQIGECSQIMSGGVLRATLHAVKALNPPHSANVARDTFVVFMQPNFDHLIKVPDDVSVSSVSVGQYKEGQDFGAFGRATIQYYYDM